MGELLAPSRCTVHCLTPQTPHSQWVAIQWPTDHHEDDPTFMHPQAAEGDRKLETYLVVVLRQLGVATEGTDSGVTEQTSEAAAGHTQYQVEVEHSTEENQPPEMGRSCGLVTMEIQYNTAGGTNKVCPGDPIFVSSTFLSLTSSRVSLNFCDYNTLG